MVDKLRVFSRMFRNALFHPLFMQGDDPLEMGKECLDSRGLIE